MYEAHRTEGVLCQFFDVITIQIENLKYLQLVRKNIFGSKLLISSAGSKIRFHKHKPLISNKFPPRPKLGERNLKFREFILLFVHYNITKW